MKPFIAANLLYFPVTRLAGERIRHHLAKYRQHDHLSPEELRLLQAKALEKILAHAGATTIHYGEPLTNRSSDFPSTWEQLDGIRPVTKDLIRTTPERFMSSRVPRGTERKTTSGSTGHPLTIMKDRDALARERAATWRAYGWAGIPVAAPQGLLWGLPHSSSARLRSYILDFLANRKRLSMFGITESELEHFRRQLNNFKPFYLYGYVSALLEFVRYLESTRHRLPSSVRCLITTSELLDDASRAFLQETTGLRVYNEYGCGEVGSIAHECEKGQMHVMADNLILECIPQDDFPAGVGELVVTDLHNRAMPLIRYRLGDLGILSSDACECGRPYPTLDRIVGRAYDTIVGTSGRKYHPESLLYVFEDLRRSHVSLPPYQAIQRTQGQLELWFETDHTSLLDIQNTLSSALETTFGADFVASYHATNKLSREPSGKLRVVKRIDVPP